MPRISALWWALLSALVLLPSTRNGTVLGFAIPAARGKNHQQRSNRSVIHNTITRRRRTAFTPPPPPVSSTATQLSALIPLSPDETQQLVTTGAPTGAQYATYWGHTPRERYGRMVESALVSFLGIFFSYFLSFVLGSFVAAILGCLFVFWGVLSPELKAYQRNWEFLGGRPLVDLRETQQKQQKSSTRTDPNKAGLYSALFVGHIADVCVVQEATDGVEDEYDISEFADYKMETDEMEKWTGRPYLLRIKCCDSQDREMQIHARLSQEYTDPAKPLVRGLPVTAILLSTQPSFGRLAALTDLYVPDVDLWIGDYPYLDRSQMENLLATDDFVWDSLQAEAVDIDSDVGGEEENRGDSLKQRKRYKGEDDYGDNDYKRSSSRSSKDGSKPVTNATPRNTAFTEELEDVDLENDPKGEGSYYATQEDDYVPARRKRRREGYRSG